MKRLSESRWWMVKGTDRPEYFYVDCRLTKSEMIQKHTQDKGKTWTECRRNGDRCVRVKITEL
jgi:hypothetical protein